MNKYKLSYIGAPHEIKNRKYGCPQQFEKLLNKILMNKFNSQVCTTKEQSQRLLDLGLNPETADMYHTTFYRDNVGYEIIHIRNEKLPLLSQEFPAWGLHRLMEIAIKGNETLLGLVIVGKNNTDDCYERLILDIEQMIKDGYFNKEYLKQ